MTDHHDREAPKTLNTLLLDVFDKQQNLSSDMSALKSSVAILLDDRVEAREGRRSLHTKLEELANGHAKLEALPAKVEKLEGRVNTLESHHDQQQGAVKFGGLLWKACGGAGIVSFLAWLLHFAGINVKWPT